MPHKASSADVKITFRLTFQSQQIDFLDALSNLVLAGVNQEGKGFKEKVSAPTF